MSPTLSLVLLSVFVLVMVVFVGWMLVSTLRSYSSIGTWPRVAKELGLTHAPCETPGALDPGTMQGSYRDYDVRIERVGKRNQVDGMRIKLSFPQPLEGEPQLPTFPTPGLELSLDIDGIEATAQQLEPDSQILRHHLDDLVTIAKLLRRTD